MKMTQDRPIDRTGQEFVFTREAHKAEYTLTVREAGKEVSVTPSLSTERCTLIASIARQQGASVEWIQPEAA